MYTAVAGLLWVAFWDRVGSEKPRTITLIRYRHGSFALITHFDAWKLLDMGV